MLLGKRLREVMLNREAAINSYSSISQNSIGDLNEILSNNARYREQDLEKYSEDLKFRICRKESRSDLPRTMTPIKDHPNHRHADVTDDSCGLDKPTWDAPKAHGKILALPASNLSPWPQVLHHRPLSSTKPT